MVDSKNFHPLRWLPPSYAVPSIHWAPVISFRCYEKACVGVRQPSAFPLPAPTGSGLLRRHPPTYAAPSIHWAPVTSFHCTREDLCWFPPTKYFPASGLHRIGVAALASANVCRAQHPLGPRDQLPLPRELLVLASTNRVISRSRPPPDRGCLPGSGIHRTGVRTPASTGPDQPS